MIAAVGIMGYGLSRVTQALTYIYKRYSLDKGGTKGSKQ